MALRGASVAADARGNGVVRVEFSDGHASEFHAVWLKDHDPSTVHATSQQRQRDPLALDLSLGAPTSAELEDGGSGLRVAWGDDELRFPAAWLREHCYDEAARSQRREALAGTQRLWASADLPKAAVERVPAAELSADGDTGEAAALACLRALQSTGVCIVTGMPASVEETEAVVRRLGFPRETFYGAMWDTAPKDASQVNDTAYTKDALEVHTDTCYLLDSPGLQLFNCVAQSEAASPDGLNAEGELEGATRLLDGFKVIEDLRHAHPDTFAFFERVPLKWQGIEDGVHVKAWAKVIQLEFDADADADANTNADADVDVDSPRRVRQFRYNPYDLSPVDYLPARLVPEYFRHTRVLNEYLRSAEYISLMRMEPGEMVVINNHRVCHGRTAFAGFRNMVGCYVGRDDWLSRLRVLGPSHRIYGDE